MPNNPINKVVFDGRTLIDLTDTTATADKIKTGYGAYGADGVWMDGTAATGGENGDVYQDEDGYLVLAPGPGTNVAVQSVTFSANSTYTAPSGVAYSPVTVDVQPKLASLTVTPLGYSQTFSTAIGSSTQVLECTAKYFDNTKSFTPVIGQEYRAEYWYSNNDGDTYTRSFSWTLTWTGDDYSFTKLDTTYGLLTSSSMTAYRIDQHDSSRMILYEVELADGFLPVVVNGISSTYIGDGVPRKSSADLTASGSYINGPSGYYSQAFSKAVSAGRLQVSLSEEFAPNMYINSATGMIGALGNGMTIRDSANSGTFGYVDSTTSSAQVTLNWKVSSSMTLPTLAVATYTPTEASQIIDRYRWLTGSQTIAAISSTYVGTGVARRSDADMYQSQKTIYAPSGYYGSNTAFQVPYTNHTDPTLTFISATGFISASHDETDAITNYSILQGRYVTSSSMTLPVFAATTWTPGTSNQTISRYQWLTGSQTILGDANLVPSNIASGVSIFGVTGTHQGGSADPYTDIYKSLAYRQTIYSSGSMVSEWINSLSSINSNQFTNASFHGDFVFSNVSRIGRYAFASTYVNVATPVLRATASFPSLIELGGECTFAKNYNFSSVYFPILQFLASYTFYCAYTSYIEAPECTYIGSSAFNGARIVSYSFPKCELIYNYAFASSPISIASFSKCISVREHSFESCKSLVEVSLPVCTSIYECAFYACSKLESLYIPECDYIGSYVFASCSSLQTIDIPKCEYIGYAAFSNCITLTSINALSCSLISDIAFLSCSKLVSAYFPECSIIGQRAFSSCSSLEIVNFSKCTHITSQTFYSCIALNSISFPEVSFIDYAAFGYCKSLTKVIFPKCGYISTSAFNWCSSISTACFSTGSEYSGSYYISQFAFCYNYKLFSLYLLGPSIYTLNGVNAFLNTPISTNTAQTGGINGSIFVPASLYNAYISATNWATYSSRFVSLTDAEIALEPWNN